MRQGAIVHENTSQENYILKNGEIDIHVDKKKGSCVEESAYKEKRWTGAWYPRRMFLKRRRQ